MFNDEEDDDFYDEEQEQPDLGISLAVPFKKLTEEGILSLENFSCCTNCGCAEMEDKVKESEKEPHGFCFYHAQDDECRRKGRGHSFYLCYGSTKEDGTGVQVGHRIVEVLNQHGVRTNWNGDIATRIEVLQ